MTTPVEEHPLEKPPPVPTGETRAYWEGCRRHELRIQQCIACGHSQFYPRLYCTVCMSEQIEWVRASGRGRIMSFTVVYRPVTKAFAADVPYIVALIRLDEGPQLMSNIVECASERVTIGMPVIVTFEDRSEDVSVPVFRPAVV